MTTRPRTIAERKNLQGWRRPTESAGRFALLP
jgi:hypothetical protein